VYLVDKPGSVQSVIAIGRIGVARGDPDYYALEVMNTILGGSFTSRLNQNLREDKGYTYGARSSFDFGLVPGAFRAGAAVQTQSTGPALAEFIKELEGMRSDIPDEEVHRARNNLAMGFLQDFQSVAQVAGQVGELVEYDLPDGWLEAYVGRVLAVEGDDVRRVAREHIDPANLVIVVVGDRGRVEAQIRALDLGEVHVLTVTDVLGAVPDMDRPSG
jgi:zinc protease